MRGNIYLYILVMALVTYLIRMLPITFISRKIQNRFVKSFLYYVPYVTLTAMTIPSIFKSTSSCISAAFGLLIALLLALRDKSLLIVAAGASAAVFIAELFPKLPL